MSSYTSKGERGWNKTKHNIRWWKRKRIFLKIKQNVFISSKPLCILTSPSFEKGISSSIYITQPIILVHSLPELHLVPRKPLGITLSNQQQITITQHHKEVILTTQEHTPSLPLHTQSEQSFDFTDLLFYKYTKWKIITRI